MFKSVIRSVGHYVPPKVVTNSDLEKVMDTSNEWIIERTGIRERRFTNDDMPTSRLAELAAIEALKRANLSAQDVDMVVAATLSPDFFFPGIGTVLQHRMGMRAIPALDIRAQCSGLVYGLSTADAFIRSGQAKTVLLVCAEIQHPVLDMSTAGRDMAVLFGDGAGAVVLQAEAISSASERPTAQNNVRGVIDSHLGGDGGGAEFLAMKLPGTARPQFLTVEDVTSKAYQPRMDGKAVFKNAITRMLEAAGVICQRNGIKPHDLAMLFPHQANLRINEMVREKLGLPPERVFNNIEKYGNTTAATIPIAMSEAFEQGKIKEGDLIMTVAFGAGFTWGCNLIRF